MTRHINVMGTRLLAYSFIEGGFMSYSYPTQNANEQSVAGMRLIVLIIGLLIMTAVTEASDNLYLEYIQKSDSMFIAGKFDSSLNMAQRARDEAVRLYGEEDTLVATASLAIRERLRGMDHDEVAECLKGLAIIAYDNYQFPRAESLNIRAINIWENLQGEERLQLARVLNELANIKLQSGDYSRAEELYSRALMETENAVGVKHGSYVRMLNNLGLVSMWQGKYDQAMVYLQRTVSLTEDIYGPFKLVLHSMLSNISIIHLRYREFDQAMQYCERAIKIVEDSLGSESRDLIVKLHTLSIAYRFLDRLRDAEQAAIRCIELREKYYPKQRLMIASPYTTLSRIYYDLGDSASFRETYEQARSIYVESLDSRSKDLPRHLQSFSWHFRHYDTLTCLRFARHAFELRRNYLIANSRAMSEQGALKYAQFMRKAAANYLSCYIELESPNHSNKMDAANVIVASKGQVSDEIFDRNLSLLEESSPAVMALRDSLSQAKVKLSNLHALGKMDDRGDGYKVEADNLLAEKNRLETELIKQSSNIWRSRESHLVTAERVASNLPEGSGLVEYKRYQYSQRNPDVDMIHYLVLILKPDGTEPIIKNLGPAGRIDSIVSLYHQHMKSSAEGIRSSNDLDQEYRNLASILFSELWKPIEDEIADCNLVFIAPDAALNLVSFSGLIDNEGQYVVEKIPIHYLSSGRDVIWLNRDYNSGRGMIALGDPDYDAPAAERRMQNYSYVPVENISYRSDYVLHPGIQRNVRSDCPQLNEIKVARLPATQGEVEQVVEFWRENYSDSALWFLGKNATEDNLKKMVPGSRVIHVATHGFYSPAICREKETVINPEYIIGKSYGLFEPNPLLQSGLFLAGSNLHGEMADSLGIDDGILTAEEVSIMDLTGVEWVVLSACESGLGEIEAGEGVYGLRRAFQMAGARTVISSLWPVADKSTAEFMISLYEVSDQPLYEKIHRYQKAQIERLRNYGYSDHPRHWAAFIASGDWR
jgi:CHAT domain-containing protein